MLSYKIKIDYEARNEILSAAEWYNLKKIGLGDFFKLKVKKQIGKLKSNPQKYQIRYDDFRCLKIKNFPYLIHFQIIESERMVVISSFLHTSKKPIWDE